MAAPKNKMRLYAEVIDSKTVLIFDKFLLDVKNVDENKDFIIIDIDSFISVNLNGRNIDNYYDMDSWDKEAVTIDFVLNILPNCISRKTETDIHIKIEEEILVEYEENRCIYKEGTPQFEKLNKILKFVNEVL